MAFNYLNWQRWSSGFDIANNAQWNYTDTVTDNIATITAANYFAPAVQELTVGDLIWIVATDVLTGEFAQVTAVNKTLATVTVAVFNAVLGVGSVGTTNLASQAVTAAKIANNTITASQIAANGVTSAALSLDTIQYVKVPITAAQWNGMYAAPFVLIAAPGAGKMIVVDSCVLVMTFVAAQYAAGGAVALQYDTTVHGAGTLASATLAAATVNGYAASSNVGIAPALGSSAITTVQNKGLYISNQTGAFTTGDGTWNAHLAYRIVTA